MKKKKIAMLLACCITLVGCGAGKNEMSGNEGNKTQIDTLKQDEPQKEVEAPELPPIEEEPKEIVENTEKDEPSVEKKTVRIYTYDNDYNTYYEDVEIEIVNKAIVKELGKRVLHTGGEVTYANLSDGVLRVKLSQEANDTTFGSGFEGVMVDCIVNTFGYNLGAEKVWLTVGDNNEPIGKHIGETVFDVDTSSAIAMSEMEKSNFNTYKITEDSEVERGYGIQVVSSKNLEGKLTKLLDDLTFTQSNISGLKLISIEEQGNNKIANIELESYDKRWSSYFKGTTNERAMIDLLSESILQREYTGEWIDGVRFYANGQIFVGPHGMIDMPGIIYR